MAYPMAFLISPQEAAFEKLNKASDANKSGVLKDIAKTLKSIRVLSNITYAELNSLMSSVNSAVMINPGLYSFSSGLIVNWQTCGKYVCANLYGKLSPEQLQAQAEQLFESLDNAAGRNVRLIESSEFFYYNYQTEYSSLKDIYNRLKEEGAEQIFSTADNEVVADLNGQNIKYFKPENEKTFTLQVEQEVRILNIGMNSDYEGRNVSYGLTNLKIQTNIKQEELRALLHAANYLYYEAESQTPLKNSNATLNWILKDGYYYAEFTGTNNAAITKEAQIIFRKLNRAAGRDIRLINDLSTTIYTYNTNYTDKNILLNTLLEHGAEEISEIGDEVSCKLFGMEMIYYKKDDTSGYTLDITQVSNKSECEDLINDLNEEYGLNVQEITYNKIKERLEQENLQLESETVMDDNSIVLTIEV